MNEARVFAVASDEALNQVLNAKQVPKLGAEPCAIPVAEFIGKDQRPTDNSLIVALFPRISFKLPRRAPGAHTTTKLESWIRDKRLALDAPFYAPLTPEQRVADIQKELAAFKARPELVLVATEFEEPVAQGNTFSAGRLVGMLYVWSPEQKRLMCGATVEASSSSTVSASYIRGGPLAMKPDMQGAVLGDLVVNAVYEPLHHLVQTLP